MQEAIDSPVAIAHDARIGAYKVLSQLGQGGMGEVWLAEHALLGRRAAIKLLRPTLSNEEDMVSRFFNEARAAAAIADPGIVQIFDFGYYTDGRAYIVMELLDGESLDKRLARLGTMPIPAALRTIRQIASSLGAVHARNIIHRDLKPENVVIVLDKEVTGGERAKILDFGIAKLGDEIGTRRTRTAALIGTPLYMSPEQCRGARDVDARTDIYSLGCVLYELVVGEPPYDAEAVGALILKHLRAPVPRASARRNATPRVVDELIARCMAKDPAERFANGTELAHAIDGLLDAMPADGNVEDDEEWIEPPLRNRPWFAIAGVGALALGVVGFALLALRTDSTSKPAAPPPAAIAAPAAAPAPASPPPPPSLSPPPSPPPSLSPPPPPSPPEHARPAIRKTAAAIVRNAPRPPPSPSPPPSPPPPTAPHGKSFAGTTLGNDGIPTNR